MQYYHADSVNMLRQKQIAERFMYIQHFTGTGMIAVKDKIWRADYSD
jgi:hypothetical protein